MSSRVLSSEGRLVDEAGRPVASSALGLTILGAFASGNTLGTVVGSVQVLDNKGASLGYLPVYDAITTVP